MDYLKNVGSIIKILRRLLLFALVLTCSILIYREFYKAERLKSTKSKDTTTLVKEEYTLKKAEWGNSVEKLARELDMPIFFSIKDNFREEANYENLIKKNFVYTEIDPMLYPADHIALKALHCNIGENVDITCGVLTSKMYPILTSTNPEFNSIDEKPSIRAMLRGINGIYHESYNRFLMLSRNFNLLSDIPSKYHIKSLKGDREKLSFMLDFGYHEKFKAAQLSESARLGFRNCTVEKYSPVTSRIKNVAYNEIIDKLENKEEISFTERAFYARALADYVLLFSKINKETLSKNIAILENFADEIVAIQNKNGTFQISNKTDTIENAFCVTILSYTYKITKNEDYLNSIKKFANFLDKELKSHSGLKADFDKGGISGAKGYVYLSRALLNYYIVSLDPSILNLNSQILARLDKNYNKLNSMTMELSQESPLAKYINLCSVEDTHLTSTNGVLLQVYKDMQTLKLSKEVDVLIKNILASSLNSPCSDIDFDFSLRIAKYTNPLISVDTLNKVASTQAKLKIKNK